MARANMIRARMENFGFRREFALNSYFRDDIQPELLGEQFFLWSADEFFLFFSSLDEE